MFVISSAASAPPNTLTRTSVSHGWTTNRFKDLLNDEGVKNLKKDHDDLRTLFDVWQIMKKTVNSPCRH